MIGRKGAVRRCYTYLLTGIAATLLGAIAYGQPLQNPYEDNPFGPLPGSAEPAPGTLAPDVTQPDRLPPGLRQPRAPDRSLPSRVLPDDTQPRPSTAVDPRKMEPPGAATRDSMDDNPFGDDPIQPGAEDKRPLPSAVPPRETTEDPSPSDVPESEDRALFDKINELMGAGNSEELIPLLESVVQRLPREIDIGQLENVYNVFFELGKAYRNTGRYHEAVRAFGRAAEFAAPLSPELQSETHLRRGIAWFHSGEPRIAISEFEQAVSASIVTRDPRPELWKGLAFAQQGRYRDAIQAYSNSLRNYNGYTVARSNRGLAYLAIGEVGFAVADFDEVIRQTPDDSSAYHRRAIALARRGDLREAVASYDQAIRLAADYAPSYYNRGLLHRQLGNASQAEADLAKARQLNPQIQSLARPARLARR